jgi:hypothetical protein
MITPGHLRLGDDYLVPEARRVGEIPFLLPGATATTR